MRSKNYPDKTASSACEKIGIASEGMGGEGENIIKYNNDLINPDTFLYRSVFFGSRRHDGSIQDGIIPITQQHLKGSGAWELYLGFDQVFRRIQKQLNDLAMKLTMVSSFKPKGLSDRYDKKISMS